MLKLFLTLFITFVLSHFSILKAEETENFPSNEEVSKLASEAANALEDKKVAEMIPTEEMPKVEFSESELVEMVGFLTAQGGGVPALKLNDTEIALLAKGLVDGLSSVKKLEDFDEAFIQKSLGQAQSRAEAIDNASEEIPGIEENALEVLGFVIAMQSGLAQLGFGAEDIPSIEKGFISGADPAGKEIQDEAKLAAFQKFIQKRVTEARSKLVAEGEAANKAFFEELDSDDSVLKSESGLYYKIHESGADEKPTLDDSVLVHYKGALIDGTQFDSSYDRGEPAKFPLRGVVAGFGEGLTKIGAGGKITLYIPSNLGYGDNPRPGGVIKPGDTLVFDCELVEVNPE